MKIMKLAAIAALLMVALPKSGAAYQVVLEFVVCVAGIIVSWEAGRARKYMWMVAFGLIAILFNPIAPVALSRNTFIWIDLATVLMFLTSLAVVRARPRLSMPSITNRTPGSESL
ncbi:MAG TPA: DUF6804 family protein [Candidatus Eisenbacteria bacterium]|nr:DUF6804 family protein [Candidatus Eisenbacteria bacterium]